MFCCGCSPPLSFGHLPLSGEKWYELNYFASYLDRHGFASRWLSFRSMLGELSSVSETEGLYTQLVIASDSEAIQIKINLFWLLSGSPRSFHLLVMTGYASSWGIVRLRGWREHPPLSQSDISPYQGRSDIMRTMTTVSLPTREGIIYYY